MVMQGLLSAAGVVEVLEVPGYGWGVLAGRTPFVPLGMEVVLRIGEVHHPSVLWEVEAAAAVRC